MAHEEELTVDPERAAQQGEQADITGIYVRAQLEGKWGSYDIALLVLRWLRSRGGENRMAENVIGVLLGHGQIATEGS